MTLNRFAADLFVLPPFAKPRAIINCSLREEEEERRSGFGGVAVVLEKKKCC